LVPRPLPPRRSPYTTLFRSPVVLEIRYELAGQGVFLRVLRHSEAAQIADHHQCVLIDRVGMEQVVLHLADDAPEYRQITRQDVQHCHASQSMHDSARLLQNLQELMAVDGVASELPIDVAPRMPKRA